MATSNTSSKPASIPIVKDTESPFQRFLGKFERETQMNGAHFVPPQFDGNLRVFFEGDMTEGVYPQVAIQGPPRGPSARQVYRGKGDPPDASQGGYVVLRKRKGPDGKDVYAASLVDGYYEFKKDIAVRGVADLDPDEIEQQFKMQEDSRKKRNTLSKVIEARKRMRVNREELEEEEDAAYDLPQETLDGMGASLKMFTNDNDEEFGTHEEMKKEVERKAERGKGFGTVRRDEDLEDGNEDIDVQNRGDEYDWGARSDDDAEEVNYNEMYEKDEVDFDEPDESEGEAEEEEEEEGEGEAEAEVEEEEKREVKVHRPFELRTQASRGGQAKPELERQASTDSMDSVGEEDELAWEQIAFNALKELFLQEGKQLREDKVNAQWRKMEQQYGPSILPYLQTLINRYCERQFGGYQLKSQYFNVFFQD